MDEVNDFVRTVERRPQMEYSALSDPSTEAHGPRSKLPDLDVGCRLITRRIRHQTVRRPRQCLGLRYSWRGNCDEEPTRGEVPPTFSGERYCTPLVHALPHTPNTPVGFPGLWIGVGRAITTPQTPPVTVHSHSSSERTLLVQPLVSLAILRLRKYGAVTSKPLWALGSTAS